LDTHGVIKPAARNAKPQVATNVCDGWGGRAQAAEAAAALEAAKGREAVLAAELSKTKATLAAALTEKAELEEALGLMDRNNTAEVARLQVKGEGGGGAGAARKGQGVAVERQGGGGGHNCAELARLLVRCLRCQKGEGSGCGSRVQRSWLQLCCSCPREQAPSAGLLTCFIFKHASAADSCGVVGEPEPVITSATCVLPHECYMFTNAWRMVCPPATPICPALNTHT
jgi:hypothetical protein